MIGSKIKSYRIKQGITQGQLAEKVDLDVSTICKIEKSKSKPSLDSLTRLAKALNVPVSELLN